MSERRGHAVSGCLEGSSERPETWQGYPRPTENPDEPADPVLRRACQRSLEIIGEAAKKVDESFKVSHPGLPWRDMAAMRDRLIHGYFGVDDAIVWDVMQGHIPQENAALRQLLARE